MARLLRWTSTALIATGVLLIALAAGSYGYAAIERYRVEQVYSALDAAPPPDPAPAAAAPAEAEGTPRILPRGEAPATPEASPAPATAPAPASLAELPAPVAPPQPPQPSYAPAVRIKLPSAGIDARVVEAGVIDGEFEVPKFAVAHYRHTALPGQPGNGIYAGHVSSISSGDVFANLHRAKVGDEVLLQTQRGVVRYTVSEVRVVPRTATEVLAPTPSPTITLIACTGAWDWQLRDYLERLVVRAELVAEPPAS
jgi:LPXTG-site transpeptidase (sortase) family protein